MKMFSQESMSNSYRVESVPITPSKSQPGTAAQCKGLRKGKLLKANSPRAFHAFPNLPPELQNMIWRHSLPGPRVIRAAYVQREDYVKGSFVFRDARPLAALHVCQNSRQAALNFYKPLSESISANDAFEFDSEFECNSADDKQSQDSGSRMPRSRSIYFDPALYVEFAEGFPDIKQVQSLAIDYYPDSHIIKELCHIMFALKETSRKYCLQLDQVHILATIA
ncbi:hypothetical protein BGZ60DRAFT_550769 [Tricladium varicosporioides]|nr:hypothetical protein BGZ60DRAFT_550769 [Hymenoscyphus varicosporioides]